MCRVIPMSGPVIERSYHCLIQTRRYKYYLLSQQLDRRCTFVKIDSFHSAFHAIALFFTTFPSIAMTIDPGLIGCNWTIPKYDCTLDTCCLAQGSFLYRPSFGGNLFFTVFFGIFIIPQLGLGIWYKTWGFGVGMVIGLALEVLGYASRIQLHNKPFADTPFLMYVSKHNTRQPPTQV